MENISLFCDFQIVSGNDLESISAPISNILSILQICECDKASKNEDEIGAINLFFASLIGVSLQHNFVQQHG